MKCASLFLLLASLAAAAYPQQQDDAFQAAMARAQLHLNGGNERAALLDYEQANKLHNKACPECYLAIAQILVRSGEFDEARSRCEKGIKCAQDPRLIGAMRKLEGDSFLREAGVNKKKLRSAEDQYQAALKADPNLPLALLNMGVAQLRQGRDEDGKETLRHYLAYKPPKSLADQAEKMIAEPERARHDYAPEFEVKTLENGVVKLTDLKGKTVVLDFWATWCPPCRASLPELKELVRKFPSEQLALISISADDNESEWETFVSKFEMSWPQYRDADQGMRIAFNVHSFPTYLVIDANGIVVERVEGMDPQFSVASRMHDVLKKIPGLVAVKR